MIYQQSGNRKQKERNVDPTVEFPEAICRNVKLPGHNSVKDVCGYTHCQQHRDNEDNVVDPPEAQAENRESDGEATGYQDLGEPFEVIEDWFAVVEVCSQSTTFSRA